MGKKLSNIVSFFLGKSIISTYKVDIEISKETGWHSRDVVSLYLNGKGREYFLGWIVGVEKAEGKYFVYHIEWWPKKDLFKKYDDFCERIFKTLRYHLTD